MHAPNASDYAKKNLLDICKGLPTGEKGYYLPRTVNVSSILKGESEKMPSGAVFHNINKVILVTPVIYAVFSALVDL